MIKNGEKSLVAGRESLRQSEAKVSEANDEVRNGRAEYRNLLEVEQANAESAATLLSLQDEIAKGLDSILNGNALISRGTELIIEGHEQIRSGHKLINSGYSKTKSSNKAVEFKLTLPEKSALQD